MSGYKSVINESGFDDIESNLDTINTTIGSSNTLLSTISNTLTGQSGYLDGLEALIGVTNASIGQTNQILTLQSSYLDGIEGLIAQTNASIGQTNSILTVQNTYLDGVETLLNGMIVLQTQTNSTLGVVNTNLNTINTSIGQTNATLGIVNTNLNTINTSIGQTNATLGVVRSTLNTMSTTLTTINTSIGQTNSTLGVVNTNLGTINTSIAQTNATLGVVRSTLNTMSTTLTTINTSIGQTNATLAAIQHTVNDTVQNSDRANFVINPFDLSFVNLGRNDKVFSLSNSGYSSAVTTTWQVLGPITTDMMYVNSGSFVQLVSDSTFDISSGTYARSVRVEGFDSSGVYITEDVPLNGTTPVNAILSFYTPICKAYVISVGGNFVNYGNISIGYGATYYDKIRANENHSGSAYVSFNTPVAYGGFAVINAFSFCTDATVGTYVQLVYRDCTEMYGSARTNSLQVLFSGKFNQGNYVFENFPVSRKLVVPGVAFLRAKLVSGSGAYVSGSISATVFQTG